MKTAKRIYSFARALYVSHLKLIGLCTLSFLFFFGFNLPFLNNSIHCPFIIHSDISWFLRHDFFRSFSFLPFPFKVVLFLFIPTPWFLRHAVGFSSSFRSTGDVGG